LPDVPRGFSAILRGGKRLCGKFLLGKKQKRFFSGGVNIREEIFAEGRGGGPAKVVG